ncbi:hypothetical protein [Bradyrhizobium elkanii]|uniref:hypothetical protein n=1 Tax=Bradyrhizobium elkanii TaxID=29448 RepID=UPI0035144A11
MKTQHTIITRPGRIERRYIDGAFKPVFVPIKDTEPGVKHVTMTPWGSGKSKLSLALVELLKERRKS